MIEFNDYILTDMVPHFEKEMKKLVKKATKLDVPPVRYTIFRADTKVKPFVTGYDRNDKAIYTDYDVTRVEVTGENPSFSGWKLIASLDIEPGLGIVVNVVPGETIDPKYRNHDGSCSHCKTIRRRNNNYVLKNVDGSEAVVGRNCIKDFLGNVKIDKLLAGASFPKFFEGLIGECNESFGRCEPVYSPAIVLAVAIHDIADRGFYMSTSKAQEMYEAGNDNVPDSTRGRVCTLMFNDKPEYRYYPTSEEIVEAEKMIEWVKTLDTTSDYNHTINQLASASGIRVKYFGYLVSIPAAYARAFDLLKKKEAKRPSEYVGSVGDKLTLDLTFVNSWGFSSYYGYIIINKFVDAEGNIFVWTTSTESDFVVGTTYKVSGTVKKQEIYRDDKQTVLTRCKIK